MNHLNTLFVTTDGAWLSKEHETVVVSVNKEKRAQIPMLHLAGVVCLGRVSMSADLMGSLADAGIGVSFLTGTGRFQARVEGLPGGSVLLRRAQFRAADDAARSLAIARSMLAGKIANARSWIMHAARDGAQDQTPGLTAAADELKRRLRDVELAESVESLRGFEGNAARSYWGCFSACIKREVDSFRISERSRRPPRDRTNALLSFGYVLLMHQCAAALSSVGLDPAVGFLHEDRPGRLSLALDLMEELRTALVDRFVVAHVNRGQVQADDLQQDSVGGWSLKDDARKRFLVSWQEHQREPVQHPFLEQETTWLKVPHIQAMLLARHLRGDLDAYPPFLIR